MSARVNYSLDTNKKFFIIKVLHIQKKNLQIYQPFVFSQRIVRTQYSSRKKNVFFSCSRIFTHTTSSICARAPAKPWPATTLKVSRYIILYVYYNTQHIRIYDCKRCTHANNQHTYLHTITNSRSSTYARIQKKKQVWQTYSVRAYKHIGRLCICR